MKKILAMILVLLLLGSGTAMASEWSMELEQVPSADEGTFLLHWKDDLYVQVGGSKEPELFNRVTGERSSLKLAETKGASYAWSDINGCYCRAYYVKDGFMLTGQQE